jgi:hypothetical protein
MSVQAYPEVIGEYDTVRKLMEGYSIARFGDGEVKHMTGGAQVREPPNATLSAELRTVMAAPHPMCIIGILTMDERGPKYPGLSRHAGRFCDVLSPAMTYYSSLITRPDSAPWINTIEYARMIESLWAGKRAVVVCERKGSMAHVVKTKAKTFEHVECPRYQAYSVIESLAKSVRRTKPDVAIICAGLTATCLANRLTARGIQALDLGSAGGFLGKLLRYADKKQVGQ